MIRIAAANSALKKCGVRASCKRNFSAAESFWRLR